MHKKSSNLSIALRNRGYTVAVNTSDKENAAYTVYVAREVQHGIIVQTQVVLNNTYSTIEQTITALNHIH